MIGLFDSGIGGLTVAKALMELAPGVDFIYLGDTARYPYGNKSKDTIERYAVEDAKFLIEQGADLIIVACNTASSLALDVLHKTYPDVPIIGVIEPAAKLAADKSKNRAGVIGTRATVGSQVYLKYLLQYKPKLQVMERACPMLVPLVEEGMMDDQVTKLMIRRYLMSLRQANVETLILGCTHYPFLKPLISRFMGKTCEVIDSAQAVINHAMALYPDHFKNVDSPTRRFTFTDTSPHQQNIISRWLGMPTKTELVKL